jgi:hypothetical protein
MARQSLVGRKGLVETLVPAKLDQHRIFDSQTQLNPDEPSEAAHENAQRH